MTGTNDHDRRLAAWLEDGPSRASDRMIDHALAHARTHPRRRDPLASLRKDPMSSNTFPAVGRPITLLAAAALVVVAVFTAATVGGVFKGQPVVVPPVASPSASPSATPVASPSPSELPPGGSFPDFNVELLTSVGAPPTVAVYDQSGSMTGAESGQPGDGGSVPPEVVASIERVVEDPFTIEITWTDMPCGTSYDVTIDPTLSTLQIRRSACQGDTIAIDRVLRLTFDHAFDTTGLTPSFISE